jgi:hypothetical protein
VVNFGGGLHQFSPLAVCGRQSPITDNYKPIDRDVKSLTPGADENNLIFPLKIFPKLPAVFARAVHAQGGGMR